MSKTPLKAERLGSTLMLDNPPHGSDSFYGLDGNKLISHTCNPILFKKDIRFSPLFFGTGGERVCARDQIIIVVAVADGTMWSCGIVFHLE